eukprot:NODE_3022_length_609_cov_13.698214_g2525_i0.p2 GENE.NODE_3022_length_609_cov_13.698214_g2525_i0~~NODE_3022_length_609_cov_13.698214_g2525_i0.p2  ORF type:complete len:149 (-),score=33.07 NODE_3022_length_609_cov_13.698214_g2525_i0:111-557(-)
MSEAMFQGSDQGNTELVHYRIPNGRTAAHPSYFPIGVGDLKGDIAEHYQDQFPTKRAKDLAVKITIIATNAPANDHDVVRSAAEIDVMVITVTKNIIPDSTKGLLACLKCKLIKTRQQFSRDGCANCVDFEVAKVDEWSTANFEGCSI